MITIVLFLSTMGLANLVPNVAVIFDYMAALSISGMQFILPGYSYLKLSKKNNTGTTELKTLSVLFCCFGLVVSVTILYNNIFGKEEIGNT